MTSKYTEGFGERFRFLRRRANLSQEEIGEKLDVTRQTISGEDHFLSPISDVRKGDDFTIDGGSFYRELLWDL